MLGRKALTAFSTQWMAMAFQMLSGILIARSLGPEMVGSMGFAFGIIGLFMTVTGLGFAHAHLRRVAEGLPLDLCVGTYLSVSFLLNVLALALCALFWPKISDLFNTDLERLAFLIFLAYQFLINLSNVFRYTFLGKGEMAKDMISTFLSKGARLIFVIIALYISPNLVGVAVAMILEALFQFFSGWWMLPVRRLRCPTFQSLKSYWSYTKPLIVTAPFGVLGDSADRIIGGIYWPLAELGHYNIARSFLGMAKSVPSAGVMALFPSITEQYSKGNLNELKRVFAQGHRKLMLFVTPLTVLGMILSRPLIHLFYGEAFLPAAQAVVGFMGMLWLNTLLSPYHYLVYAMEKHQSFIWIMPISQLLYIVVFFFISTLQLPWELAWAALAGAVPNLAPMGVVMRLCRRNSGITFDWNVWRFFLAGVFMFSFYWMIHAMGGSTAGFVVGIPGGVLLYAVSIALMGKADRLDLSYLAEVLNPKKFAKYVISEVRPP